MMAQSVTAERSTSNPPGRGFSKVTWQKLRDNAINKTKFYDISQQSQLLPELRTGSTVHPQLETIDFYKGGLMSDDDDFIDYVPQSAMFYRRQKREKESGYRKVIALEDILQNFKEGQISFVGQAGSGKTTLLKAITRKVIEGNYKNLSSIEVVHFVHLITFNINDLVTPAELLFRNVTPDMSDVEMEEAMQYAKENPDKVLFVIDSLDTVPYTIDGVYTGITSEDRASPKAILFHLLSGNLLPGCRFITSSREYAIRNYKGDVRAKQVIALAGLTKESMRRIVVGYVGEAEAEKKMTYLKRKPVIESLCATPVWLIFTLIVISMKSKFTPTTMASILVILLQNMIRSEHVHEGNIEVVVGKLGNMAFTGTKEHRVQFSLDELGEFNLIASETRDLMIATPSGGYQKLILGDSILMYAHQCLQEILSAFYIAKMNLKEFKDFISEYIHTPHYAVVRRLLTGILLNNEVFEEAENFLGDATDFEQKKIYLKESLDKQLRSVKKGQDDLLEFYMCLSEAGDGAKGIFRNEVDEFYFFAMSISPSEMYSIGCVMSQQTFVTTLNLSECTVNQTSLSALYHALEDTDVQLHELDISANETLGPNEMRLIAKIFVQCQVKMLSLRKRDLKSGALKAFLDSSVGAKILLLDISDITLDGNDRTLLGKIIKQCGVETLVTSSCQDGFKLIDFKLSPDNFKISTLKCGNEFNEFEFSDSDCDSVSKFLLYVAKEVILINCCIPSHIVKILQNRLDEGKNKGSKIIFEDCYFDDSEEDVEKDSEEYEIVEHKVLECREQSAANVPSIVESRRAELNNDGSIIVSWDYPDEDHVQYHLEAFCNDQPTGDIKICKDPYYQIKTPRPSQVHCFKIWVVDSNGIAGDAMYTNEVMSRPSFVNNVRMVIVGEEISRTQSKTDLSRTGTISEPFSTEISREGGDIDLRGCRLAFQRGTFKATTKVFGKEEIDREKWPAHYVGITSMLYVNAENDLLIPATLHMKSWCTRDRSQKETIMAHVLHYCEQTSTWEVIKELPLSSEDTFRFDCLDFSPIIVGIPNESFNSSKIYVDGAIYTTGQNHFILAFHPSHPQLRQKVKEGMAESGSRLLIEFSTIIIKALERVGIYVECVDPGDFLPRPSSVYEFSVLKDSDNKQIFRQNFYLRRRNDLPYSGIIEMKSTIQKDGEILDGPHHFPYVWKPPVAGIHGDNVQGSSDPDLHPTSSNTYHFVKGTKRSYEGVPVQHTTQEVPAAVYPEQITPMHQPAPQDVAEGPLDLRIVKETHPRQDRDHSDSRRSGLAIELNQHVTSKDAAESPLDLRLVKKIHPRENRDQSVSRHSVVIPPHTLLQRQDQIPCKMEQQLAWAEGSGTFSTGAKIHAGQNYDLQDLEQPSTSRNVPPSSTSIVRERRQHYHGGPVTYLHKVHELKGTLDVEKRPRPALPPEISQPTLVMEDTRIRASWDKVEDDRVTYCIDLYCNGQKKNPEPFRTPATSIEFYRLEPSCEYRCEVWATNSHDIDGRKTWSNAVKTHNLRERQPAPEHGGDSNEGEGPSTEAIFSRGNAPITITHSTITVSANTNTAPRSTQP